jgi:hypothetical protein
MAVGGGSPGRNATAASPTRKKLKATPGTIPRRIGFAPAARARLLRQGVVSVLIGRRAPAT